MIWLLLSIVLTTALLISFKYFEKYKIDTLQAIIINYFTAALIALIFSNDSLIKMFAQPWVWFAAVLGILFVVIFRLIAITAQKIGVSVASVANKMSVIIPVIVAVYLYNDKMTALKIAGIIVALGAVYFTSKKEKDTAKNSQSSSNLLLPVLVFIGSGIIDSMVNYAEKKIITQNEISSFLTVSFISAALSGLFILAYEKLKKTTVKFTLKNLIGGVALGIPNYFSIFCLIKALNNGMESSVVIPINNIGIVGVSALYSFIVFKEKFSKVNWLGIALALLAIILIAYS